ncbi:hypothetical protein HMPREF9209_1387 [Lactobacillus gasseri 224-1]|uniref:ABC transmembrane type-1 domain-containing protein n=1 Tax=Lactobacillus gasseri 224-1 TaxID=679196 RepID=D1YGI8_LACGS|nr:hypothetical protein HMPREF9209_1387 [Lactobacillus gasseri 224-1]
MAWFTVATTPFILIISLVIMKKARIYLDKQQDKISDLNGYVNEQINGEKVIITNGLQEESVQSFKNTITMSVTLCLRGSFIPECFSPYYREFLY